MFPKNFRERKLPGRGFPRRKYREKMSSEKKVNTNMKIRKRKTYKVFSLLERFSKKIRVELAPKRAAS